MTEKPIVIIGIGHSTLHPNAASNKIIDPSLKSKIEKDGGYLANKQRVYEYYYCAELAEMIKHELNLLGIEGYTSNRYKDADINGNSTKRGAMSPEYKAINVFAAQNNGRVKAAINLHLNATPGGSGYESYSPNTDQGKMLGKLMDDNITSVLKIKNRGAKYAAGKHADLNGMSFVKYTKVPACLLELFFIDNDEELLNGVINKQLIAQAIAQAFKQFCDEDYPAVDLSNYREEMYIQSSSTVPEKIKPRFTDEDIKTSAINTQNNLTPVERRMGVGGDKYSFHPKNSIEIIGTKPPPFDSQLVDPTGNVSNSLMVRTGGVCKKQNTYPLFQAIDYTSDIPTGKKMIFANSLYEINSFETNINTKGNIRMNAGASLKLASSQEIDLISAYNVNIIGKTHMGFTGQEMTFTGNSSFEGNIGIDGNLITSGVVYAQSGLNSTSFNGPAVIDKTNTQELYGYISAEILKLILGPCTIKLSKPIAAGDTSILIESGEINVVGAFSGLGNGGTAIVTIPPHQHYFKRLNGVLSDSSVDIQNLTSQFTN